MYIQLRHDHHRSHRNSHAGPEHQARHLRVRLRPVLLRMGLGSDEPPAAPLAGVPLAPSGPLMGGWKVSPAKYVTCDCGKVCKGLAAFANHARVCPVERARSAAFIAAIEAGVKP
jgi:hypothetical protein